MTLQPPAPFSIWSRLTLGNILTKEVILGMKVCMLLTMCFHKVRFDKVFWGVTVASSVDLTC